MALIPRKKKYTAFGRLSAIAAGWLMKKGINKIQKKGGEKMVGKAIAWGFVAGAAVGSLRYFAGKTAS